ncbi:MAG: InlB B-repeat-containing protein [Lachnospiraceae bacterium]|nr:InlB B-repeat-containing protein [Lachnospiraceae bacterium]
MKRCMIFCIFVLILLLGEKVLANGAFQYPFLEFSPDGRAWTVREALPNSSDAGNKVNPSCWYPLGETIVVGERHDQVLPQVGEHEYLYLRHGMVQVYKWVVGHRAASCIHNDEVAFHGVPVGNGKCRSSYYSGWFAFCSDCGEKIHPFYIYLSRSKVQQIKEIDLDLDYYYLCPTCDHLEQGVTFEHQCRGISANRYKVKYLPNGGNVSGTMLPSLHMYGNAEMYEGEPVTPVKTLNRNVYARRGYIFAGWNTKADGTGQAFSDEQEILNLTEENYDPKTGEGIVNLYAQWVKVQGTLLIDPGEGMYLGRHGVTIAAVGYGEIYHAASQNLTAPAGFRIGFDTAGGEPLSDVLSRTHFDGWLLESPSHGNLSGEDYTFWGENGDRDRILARYLGESVTLPLPKREGYSFGGWYFDEEHESLAGMEGDLFLPKEDTILHALWVELVLRAELNLDCHEGKGAVDLSWEQKDDRVKRYLLYQKKEGGAFHRIYDAGEESQAPGAVTFGYLGREECYEIPTSGIYELEAFGAQGQDSEQFQGGAGGSVTARFYFEAGDVITVFVGGQNGDGGGGKGKNLPGGGGRTYLSSGLHGLLMVAGGGGGASPVEHGGPGGAEDGLRDDGRPEGQNGDIGGGAGYVGGLAGTYRVHVHTEACIHIHQGNAQTGGPCYDEVQQQSTCHVEVKGPFIDWDQSENCQYCIADGRYGYGTVHPNCWWIEHHGCGRATNYGSNGYWQCIVCGRIGYCWGSGQGKPVVEDHDYQTVSYVLSCDQTYNCGNPDPVAIPSHGGSSFVNQEMALSYDKKAGQKQGDGEVRIRPVNVGFQEQCELKEVYAPDEAAPERIERAGVKITAAGEDRIRVTFREPKDLGTFYYHQAESYLLGSESVLSTSNITETNVVSGLAGYYYLLDQQENTQVTAANAMNTLPLEYPEIELALLDGAKEFLHIAPVDHAGNIGESTAIEITKGMVSVPWKIETHPILVDSNVGGREYGSVYTAGDGTYYVKADGTTPFLLSFEAELLGTARDDYQIDRMTYTHDMGDGRGEGSLSLYLPHGNALEEQMVIPADLMSRAETGRELLRASMYSTAQRTDYMRCVELSQSFTMDVSCHGKLVVVTPSAGARNEEQEQCSDPTEDAENAVRLRGDGQGPLISGWDTLEGFYDQVYAGQEGLMLELTAWDELSGLEEFWLEVYQTNTGEYGIYHGDDTGKIRVDVGENEFAFSGDVTLIAHAMDHVGNLTVLEFSTKEFSLTTEIYRILPPHLPNFKRGESGILRVTVRGYAQWLEITFPEEFVRADLGLHKIIRYETPREIVTEELTFMVPLELTADGSYVVTVTAHKGDEVLTGRPELCTIQVTGNVLGEIRTRLR